MAEVGKIEFEQVEGARGSVYRCRAYVQVGAVTHIAEVVSVDVPGLQEAIPALQNALKRIAIGYIRDSLAQDEDFKTLTE